MEKVTIRLDSLKKLKQFVSDCSALDMELEVKAGELVSDARSMLGLMTLPLSSPLELCFQADQGRREKVLQVLSPYLA